MKINSSQCLPIKISSCAVLLEVYYFYHLTTALDHAVYILLLHSLSRILSQAASSNAIRLAVLQDKQRFSSITGTSVTTASRTITNKADHKEPVTILTDDDGEDKGTQSSKSSTCQGQKMDVTQSQGDVASMEIGSQVASLNMSDASTSSASTGNGEHAAQFTLGMLSSALLNVNKSLGIATTSEDEQVATTPAVAGPSQSDKDSYIDVPGEKRPRLDTHEVLTMQQKTLPQDIHDKLHSNIR